MIQGNIDPEKVQIIIDKFTPKIKAKLKTLVILSGRDWQTYIRTKFFTGYSYGKKSGKLQSRTSFLSKSIQPAPVTVTKEGISGGINIGASYARTHVGPKGQVTTIKPVKKKWLTIPLEAAMTPKGEVRGSAQDKAVWGNTFFDRNDKGDLILYGQKLFQKGAKTGQAGGKIVPLFLLRKEIKVKTRIHPEVIFKWGKAKFIENLQKEILK